MKRYIEALTQDIRRWEQAADNIDKMLAELVDPDREHWIDIARRFRQRAQEYRALIEHAKTQ